MGITPTHIIDYYDISVNISTPCRSTVSAISQYPLATISVPASAACLCVSNWIKFPPPKSIYPQPKAVWAYIAPFFSVESEPSATCGDV